MTTGALQGIRILDFTNFQQGPSATALLSDLGAEVIKIERPGIGDLGRLLGVRPNGYSTYFHTHSRGKKSITVDLKKPDGLELVYRLVKTADIVVDNFQGGTMERMGLGYERLSAINPRIICASASGFGPNGPRATSPSFAPIGSAVSGTMKASWGGDTPLATTPGGGASADQVGGMILAFAISAALVARERLGVGQKVDTSQYGSMLNHNCATINGLLYKDSPGSLFGTGVSAGIGGAYLCSDGRYVYFGFLPSNSGDKWFPLCSALEWPDWQEDPAFATPQTRSAQTPAIRERMVATISKRPAAEWVERFDRWDIPSTVVNTYEDVATDPQALANGYVTTVDNPKWGPQKVVGVVVAMSKTPGAVQGLGPELGQDNERYLEEVGYSKEEIQRLREQKVI
jgi:crotonobetainyl-CoA:carnitine CoA-transferase CaiB-like acyl-CoA transferase